MNIVASYDSTLASAPAGFTNAVQAACNYFDTMFTNNITVNITFSWGALSNAHDIAQSETYSSQYTYASVKSALTTHAQSVASAYNAYSLASEDLPSADPFNSGSYLQVSEAEATALGLGSFTGTDGIVTLGSSYSWNFAGGGGDAVSALEHEISEVLGRRAGSDGNLEATAAALFRYSSQGAIDTSSSYANAYLSLDGGATNLGAIGEQGGDLEDWGASVKDDPFGYLNGAEPVSVTDLNWMSALGYTLNYGLLPGVTVNGGANAPLVIGTTAADTLSSSTPNAFIYGAGGQDTITLGAAGETVDLNAPGVYGDWAVGQGLDTINNFQSGGDHLAIDMSAFGVSPGSYAFVSGPGAEPSSARPTFYFDTSSDYLWFDPDGTGSQAASLVAFLPGANLSAGDLTPAQVSFTSGANVVNQSPGSTSFGEGQDETLWATGASETLQGGPYREQYIAQAKNDAVVVGNSGGFVAGLGGNDTLEAGASGADTFYFNSPSAGVDTIFGFSEANGDKLDIKGSAFSAPTGFNFTDGVGFVQGPGATALAQTATFAYDTSTGYLWYDADGTGPAARTLVAFLPGSPPLHAADVVVS